MIRALIPDSMVIPGSSGSLQMVDHTDRCVIGQCLSRFPILQRTLQSDVCQLPCILVIIGNVRGARQVLPDPDWKAEDQRGALARTSWGNNNDDDNQGGDIPSWMFKE